MEIQELYSSTNITNEILAMVARKRQGLQDRICHSS